MRGVLRTEEHGSSTLNQYQWNQHRIEKEATNGLASGRMMENLRYDEPAALYDQNITRTSENSNNSEISRAMEKIAETNQLMAQQQVTQQRALQALLLCQEQSSETQEATQQVQTQALRALVDMTEQRGFDVLFNRITKFDGKDPQKCHFWLNQVHVACLESGRKF